MSELKNKICCKAHNKPANFSCMANTCLCRILCEDCKAIHPEDHKELIINIAEAFEADIASKLDEHSPTAAHSMHHQSRIFESMEPVIRDFKESILSQIDM